MSTSSGLMPLSLISEHKTAQGNPSPVQQLSFSPEKLPLVQVPKPTPNGMEPSPPLLPELPPSQPEPQPNLPCGGVTHSIEEEKSGRLRTEVEAGEILPPTVPEQFVAEPGDMAPSAADVHVPPATVPVVSELTTPSEGEPSAVSSTEPQLSLPADEAPETPSNQTAPTQPAQVPTSTQVESQHSSSGFTAESLMTVTVSAHQTNSPPPKPTIEAEVNSPDKEPPAEQQTAKKPAEEKIIEQSPTENGSLQSPSHTSVGRPSKRKATCSTPEKKSAPLASTEQESNDVKRAKRKRLPTQVYQSPIPEENIIAKISKIDKPPVVDDKLIVFYRNEFLAVRNTEGGFYVCQAMQNVYKSSLKIRIRWLSQVQNSEHYSPDFYDTTEFDCILTNLNLERIEKNKYRLPEVESQRTLSILKRAIDVENGVAPAEEATVTEEHPDGLDLSLYRNEDQLKRRKRVYRNRISKKKIRITDSDGNKKRKRGVAKGSKFKESKKASSTSFSQSAAKRYQDRICNIDTPVVQRIVAAKKLGKRKSSLTSGKSSVPVSSAKEVKKKEAVRTPTEKKKSSEPATSTNLEKKLKPGISKTKSGVAEVPCGQQSAQQQQPSLRARRSTNMKK